MRATGMNKSRCEPGPGHGMHHCSWDWCSVGASVNKNQMYDENNWKESWNQDPPVGTRRSINIWAFVSSKQCLNRGLRNTCRATFMFVLLEQGTLHVLTGFILESCLFGGVCAIRRIIFAPPSNLCAGHLATARGINSTFFWWRRGFTVLLVRMGAFIVLPCICFFSCMCICESVIYT